MTDLTERFQAVLSFATELHRHQRRKGTSIPYMSHLLGVDSIALEIGADEDQAIAQAMEKAHAPKKSYRISPGDILTVSVFQEEDLKKEVRVDQSGKVSLPLVGEVALSGLTIQGSTRAVRRLDSSEASTQPVAPSESRTRRHASNSWITSTGRPARR